MRHRISSWTYFFQFLKKSILYILRTGSLNTQCSTDFFKSWNILQNWNMQENGRIRWEYWSKLCEDQFRRKDGSNKKREERSGTDGRWIWAVSWKTWDNTSASVRSLIAHVKILILVYELAQRLLSILYFLLLIIVLFFTS